MDSSISNPNPTLSTTNASNISSPSPAPNTVHFVAQTNAAFPFKGSQHHHHHEGVLGKVKDIGNGDEIGFASMEESGLFDHEDLFAKYIDVDTMGCVRDSSEEGEKVEVDEAEKSDGRDKENHVGKNEEKVSVGVQQHTRGGFCSKKVTGDDELAKLWVTDPRRAKRIVANRQSAARSKERKARYIAALEERLETVEKEVRILAAQLSMSKRDATGLTAENTELRLQLGTLVRQAQLCDDLNEALKREVERLRLDAGEIRSMLFKNSGRHHKPYSSKLSLPAKPHDVRLLPLFHTSPSSTTTRPHSGNLHSIAHGCLQGPDNRDRGCLVSVENQRRSALASEDSISQEPENVRGRKYLVMVASPSISDTGSESSAATF